MTFAKQNPQEQWAGKLLAMESVPEFQPKEQVQTNLDAFAKAKQAAMTMTAAGSNEASPPPGTPGQPGPQHAVGSPMPQMQRELTPIEVAYGAARGYNWAQQSLAAHGQQQQQQPAQQQHQGGQFAQQPPPQQQAAPQGQMAAHAALQAHRTPQQALQPHVQPPQPGQPGQQGPQPQQPPGLSQPGQWQPGQDHSHHKLACTNLGSKDHSHCSHLV